MSDPKDTDEPFLSRWSRMKRDAAVPQPDMRCDETERGHDTTAAAPDGAAQGVPREDELDLSTLPKVDELTCESDITLFLDKRVPAILRNAALSRMWTLDPVIRDFIEVAENQWNWNVPGGAPFYAPIEAEEAATLMAQAAEAAAKSALPAAVPGTIAAQSQHETVEAASKDRDGSVGEPSGEHHAAGPAHGEAQRLSDNGSSELGEAVAAPIAPALGAVQHATQDEPPIRVSGRRRHGGALPS